MNYFYDLPPELINFILYFNIHSEINDWFTNRLKHNIYLYRNEQKTVNMLPRDMPNSWNLYEQAVYSKREAIISQLENRDTTLFWVVASSFLW